MHLKLNKRTQRPWRSTVLQGSDRGRQFLAGPERGRVAATRYLTNAFLATHLVAGAVGRVPYRVSCMESEGAIVKHWLALLPPTRPWKTASAISVRS